MDHEANEGIDSTAGVYKGAPRRLTDTGLHDIRLYPFAHRTGFEEGTVSHGTLNEGPL